MKQYPEIVRPHYRHRLVILGLFTMCLMAGGASSAAAANLVTVNATAVSEYVRPVDARGKPRAESYVFTEGKFFSSPTVDTSVARIGFNDIIQVLAPALAKQNYFPTKEVPAANLILMVHWGTTQVFEDPQKEFATDNMNAALNDYRTAAAANSGDADPGALNAALAENRNTRASAQGAIARNAALLGYKATLQREQQKIFVSPEEQTINEELNEERYFIIVMAYDYQLLLKERKSKLLWITRLSIRSPGTNFEKAIPAIALAGAGVYGQHVDGLVRVKANGRIGRVDLGELKTVGPEAVSSDEKARP
jgi:hypothetical protein